jgi:hypothetical protein
MARRLVKDLKKAGHTVVSADFTYGANEDLCNPITEHPDDKDE